MRIKIAQFGLGAIGLETLKSAAKNPGLEIVAAIDSDPAKHGKDLAELTQTESLRGINVYRSLADAMVATKPEIIFHTAGSKFREVASQLDPIVRQGISVVSSCEELLFPQHRDPLLAARLDSLCKETGARVVGTGVNPGFVMDLLPVLLTGICQEVREVHVQRIVNASQRRAALQKKIGSGLPPEIFRQLFNQGKIGHAGLQESAALVAYCLGWKLEELSETGTPIVAQQDIRTAHVEVRKGQTCGLNQQVVGKIAGRPCLSLDLKMYLEAPDAYDAIQIGAQPSLSLKIERGVAGDQATVAALINTAPRLLEVPPGLLLVTELPVVSRRTGAMTP